MTLLLTEAWTTTLVENFFADDSFLADRLNHDMYVENDVIHSPRAGAPTGITINPTYPLAQSGRVDIPQPYTLANFASDERIVHDIELIGLSYQKRNSMIAEDKAALQNTVAEYIIDAIGIDDTSSTAGVAIVASGSGTVTLMDGTNRVVKYPTRADVSKLTMAYNTRKLPIEGRTILLSPECFQAFVESDPIIISQMGMQAAVGNVNVGVSEVKIWGWTFKARTGLLNYTGSVGNGFQKVAYGASLPTGSATAAMAYIANRTWAAAIGTVKMFNEQGKSDIQGDKYSFLMRAGGYIHHDTSAGVIICPQ